MYEAATRKQKVRYKYDALGRRVQRFIPGGKESTKFTYDGDDVLVDDNLGTLTKYLNGEGIDNKLRQTTGSTASYFLADHLGSTNGLADPTGALTSQTAYDSFGNPTGSLATRYGFTGRERDDFTGLMYYRARSYDPKLGRFISEDPIGFAGGDVNLYGYVKNKAVSFSDPFGLDEYWMMERLGKQQPSNRPVGEALDEFQLKLGVMGLIPVIGEPCDAADGIISLFRGDYTGAGTSAGSMVPFFGWGFGGLKNINRVDDAVDGYRAVSKAEADDIAKNGFRPNPSGRSMDDKWFSESREGAEKFLSTFSDLDVVIHTKVPRDVYNRSFKHPNIDNTGPGFCVPCSDLPSLRKPK